jgi:hypothetical protein
MERAAAVESDTPADELTLDAGMRIQCSGKRQKRGEPDRNRSEYNCGSGRRGWRLRGGVEAETINILTSHDTQRILTR